MGRDTGRVIGVLLTAGAVTAAAVTTAVVLIGGALEPTAVRLAPVAELASATLTDDAGGTALFAVTDLLPGRAVSRCLTVAYTGTESPAGSVRLVADDVTGPLAAHLHVEVRLGTGGGFGDCTGFTGTTFFEGTLAELAAAGAGGVTTGWTPGEAQARTYRITVTMDGGNELKRAASTATFRWLVVPPPAVVVTSAPVPVPGPTGAEPTPDPTATDRPVTDAPQSPASATDVPTTAVLITAVPTTGTVTPSAPTTPMTPGAPIPPTGDDPPSALAKIIEGVVAVTGRVAGHAGIPIGLLLVVLTFFAVQHAIDRRDPKLALAPLWRSRHLRHLADDLSGTDVSRTGDPRSAAPDREVP
jgi:hypothetical protein